jgi:tetratricopeptide (TPR) repeat protein
VAALAIAAAIAATPRERRWVSLFGLVWIAVFLAPTFVRTRSGVVQHYLEHRMYLPSFGLLLILLESSLLRSFRLAERRHAIALGAVLALCAGIILTHSQNFSDRMRFWQSAVSSSPSHPLAERNLGAMFFMIGRYPEAEEHSLRALELNPVEEMVQNNLGLIYSQRGDFDRAAEAFRREIETNPGFADSYFNLAVLYLRGGGDVSSGDHFRPALALLEETLRKNPNHIGALKLMAQLYALLGETERSAAVTEELERRGL